MKKRTPYLPILLFATLCLTSCFSGRDPIECDPSRCSENALKRVIKDYVIERDHWKMITTDEGSFYFYEKIFEFPEMKEYVYDNGITMVYLETTESDGLKIQHPLPYTRFFLESDGYRWTQMITYNIATGSPGSIAFTVWNSDFEKGLPNKMHFRVASVW